MDKVLNRVLSSNSALFKETVGQFIDNPKYDLTFTLGDCSGTADACTNADNIETTGEIFIKFDNLDLNPIDLAANILHEGVHAEIFRYVQEHHEGNVDPNDKPRLFEYYKYYKLAVDEKHIDHPYMAEYYIEPIAKALRALDNFQYEENYYKIFALDGIGSWGLEENELINENFSQYRNEVSDNFSIECDE
ncbi:hypothetical protein ACW6QP_03250 [Salegentibacter sp. HM20]